MEGFKISARISWKFSLFNDDWNHYLPEILFTPSKSSLLKCDGFTGIEKNKKN
jgi:hypothetical protein